MEMITRLETRFMQASGSAFAAPLLWQANAIIGDKTQIEMFHI
jgi:hypothetical protein